MRTFISVFSLLLGIVGGLYVGGYLMFFGGIIDIINSIKSTPLETTMLAVGILKFLFASIVGWMIFYIGMAIASVTA